MRYDESSVKQKAGRGEGDARGEAKCGSTP